MTATCNYNVMIFDILRCFNIGCKYISLYLKSQYLHTIFLNTIKLSSSVYIRLLDYTKNDSLFRGDLKNRPKQSSIKPSGQVATACRLCKEQEKTDDKLDLEKLLESPESK